MPHSWHSCVWLIFSCNSVDFLHTGHRPEATWVGDQDNILLPCGINGFTERPHPSQSDFHQFVYLIKLFKSHRVQTIARHFYNELINEFDRFDQSTHNDFDSNSVIIYSHRLYFVLELVTSCSTYGWFSRCFVRWLCKAAPIIEVDILSFVVTPWTVTFIWLLVVNVLNL